jgi:riboflavin synthase
VFTGLISDVGSVTALQRNGARATLRIRSALAAALTAGDSIAVNGVCLTVTDVDAEAFRADAIEETLRRSSLGDLEPGSRVNLEPALRAQDRLGGHIVQGHVDGTGVVRAIHADGAARVLRVQTDAALERYLVEKGSVALDGVSLTISALREDGFEVALIPQTLRRTTLGTLGEGARVNVEVDIIAKQLQRLLEARA